ncbi:MAG: hypothetical protein ACRDYY_10445 [Acidimicrobiales bacterium]
MDEVKAMVAWGVFKAVVTDPSAWVNDTVARAGQIWDVGYRFAQPPSKLVSSSVEEKRHHGIDQCGGVSRHHPYERRMCHPRPDTATVQIPTASCRS